MYHSGFTRDLDNVITKIAPLYDAIYVVGFSLGGNMILKYLGEGSYNFPQQLKFCLAFSVPADLATSSVKLTHWSNIGYTKRFLKSLSAKMIEKAKSYPEIDLSHLTKMKELMDFDEHYTSKLHGFNDAQDYYARSNCKQFLHNISIPALLINAIDDPFLTKECLPYDEGSQSDYFHFLPVTNGGHVGFTQSWGTFSLETLLDFGFKLLA
jgi:uncharacterized protein